MKLSIKLGIFTLLVFFWSCTKEACMNVDTAIRIILKDKNGILVASEQNYREFFLRYSENNQVKSIYPDQVVDGAVIFYKLSSICSSIHNFELYRGNKKLGDIFLKGRIESIPCSVYYIHEKFIYNGVEIAYTDATFFSIVIDDK